MGPVFAFWETAMNCTFIDFSIEAEMPRRRGPATLLLRSGGGLRAERIGADATSPLNFC